MVMVDSTSTKNRGAYKKTQQYSLNKRRLI